MWGKRVFEWAERRVDPFAPYIETVPADSPLQFLIGHMRNFWPIMWPAAISGFVVAGLELGLIWYAGRLIDLMASGTASFWADHGVEVLWAAILLLLIRPIAVAVNFILLFCGISTNMLAQVRWRSHNWMLGQSVGFFQNDFAGRLANRVMQTGIAVEDTAFILFDAFWQTLAFAVITLVLLTQMSVWLVLPMALWIAIFVAFLTWFAPIAGEFARKNSEGNSRVTGRIVDSYTNIETVKLFAHTAQEGNLAKAAIRRHRLRFGALMRLFAAQTAAMAVFNSAALLGPALWLWSTDALRIGEAV